MAAVTNCVVLLAVLAMVVRCQQPQIESVIFQKHHSMYTTKSHWLITTIHDFSSYPHSLKNIKSNLDKVFTDAISMLTRLIDIAKTHQREYLYGPYIQLFKLTRNDVLHLYSLHSENNEDLNDLLTVLDPVNYGRTKRALLPLGGFFKSLFGTASNKDVQKIKKAVQDLARRQNDQGALLSEALSLINITRVDVEDNRHAINDLVNATGYLMEKTREIDDFRNEFNVLRTFVISHTELTLVVLELRDNINKFRSYLENLKLTLDTLGLNKLTPSVISPTKLWDVLLNIHHVLPRNLQLPVDPTKDLFHYYKYFTCESFVVDHIFSTITMVPLLDASSKFNLYQLHNLAIPDMSLNLSVSYVLENNFIAISESIQHFALLTNQDYYKCAINYNHYCSFENPLYLANHHQSCIMALYRKSKSEIQQFCQIQFSKHIVSTAVYLGKGLWTILVTEPENHLKITCIGRPNRLLKITGSIKMVQLEKSCTGYADSFILPAYFEGHSQINNNMGPNIDLINTSLNASQFQIWQNLNASNPVARKFTLTKLDPMKRYYVSNVNSALRAYQPNLQEDNEWDLTD